MSVRAHLQWWRLLAYDKAVWEWFQTNIKFFLVEVYLICLPSLYDRGLQTTARGPNLVREALSSGHKDMLSIMENRDVWEKFVDWQNVTLPKQSHHVRYPAIVLLCNNLCCPLSKPFGDPCSTITATT